MASALVAMVATLTPRNSGPKAVVVFQYLQDYVMLTSVLLYGLVMVGASRSGCGEA